MESASVIRESEYRTLGGSGIRVSPLGAGTNRWAQGSNDEAVFETFRSLVDAGVNFFDTAEIYNMGRSERLLGACLQQYQRPVIIASKFMPSPWRLSSGQFMNALNASLNRLGIRTIDLYFIHFPYTMLSVETLMDFMAQAVKTGKVRSVGVSNFNAEQMRRAATQLARHGIPLAANEVRYNLLHRQPETDGVLEACRELNVALVAYRPLEGGRLMRDITPTASSGSSSMGGQEETGSKEEVLQKALKVIAQQRRKSLSQVALNWLLRRDEHVIPIPGTTDARHALENIGSLGWELSDDEFAAIDRASSP